jgi:nicotinamide-nucleotide amidase
MTTVESIAAELLARGWRMATAESCTGGMIASACTDLPGSSQWFAGSIVTYTVEWKCRYLGVPSQTIDQYGVVSNETALAMVNGCREHCGVEAAVAVTGIAGPTGAEPGKPLGTVFIAASAGPRPPVVRRYQFTGDRAAVRRAATTAALELLLGEIRICP